MHSYGKVITTLLLLPLITLSLSGCALFSSDYRQSGHEREKMTRFMEMNKAAARHLTRTQSGMRLAEGAVILVTTPADIDNLETTDAIGRLIGEQLASGMTQQGYQVVETRTRNTIKIRPRTGEFILSRRLEKLARTHSAQYVIAGTFRHMSGGTFVSLRMIEPTTGNVLSSYDYILPRLEVE